MSEKTEISFAAFDPWRAVGNHAPSRFFADKHWGEPVRWNKAAEREGVRRRVFCARADVFEQLPSDHPQCDEMTRERDRLFDLIEVTPWLDWLLLTKRPENIGDMLPSRWQHGEFPANIWLGFTAENQQYLDERMEYMEDVVRDYDPAVVFASIEPMLGPVSVHRYLSCKRDNDGDGNCWIHRDGCPRGLDWVIVGGESGPGARPMHPDWVRSIRDQCSAAGVAFNFKQWGAWAPGDSPAHGTHWDWVGDDKAAMKLTGKKAAGHLLDGAEYLEFPSPTKPARTKRRGE